MEEGFIIKKGIVFNSYGYLLFASPTLKKGIEMYKKEKCDKIILSYLGYDGEDGFMEKDLSFLNEIEVPELIILSTYIKDFSAINNQKGLVILRLQTGEPVKQTIDFSNFPKLKEFVGYWGLNLKNLFAAKTIKSLTLWNYNPKSNDLSELAGLENLEYLELTRSRITSLTGIGKLKKLKEVELAYCSKLSSFGKDKDSNIKTLTIESCKAFDPKTIPALPKLKKKVITDD